MWRPTAEGEWLFSVRDNGIGIDPRQHDQIFRPFKRLWGEKYPAAGIGLTIAKRIIERHGGRVWLGEAPPGGGACLKFAIPT